MIIFRYLIKETLKTQLAIFLVLMTIFSSQKLVRVLADAAEGGIPAELVFSFIALKLPALAGLILPLSFFLGILIAHGRMYADSEMTVLHACGVSEWYVTRVMLVLSFVAALLAATLTIWLGPYSQELEYQLSDELAKDSGLATLVPGRFQQTSNQSAVLFVHKSADDSNQLQGVFVASNNADSETPQNVNIVYAKTGKVIEDQFGSQRLILQDGKRYDGELGQLNYQIVDFGSYEIQIKEQEAQQKRRKLSAMPLNQLGDTADAQAELQWRFAVPLALPFLTLIAVPLAKVSPRHGKFGKIGPAILLYLGYFALLMVGRNAIEDEVIPTPIGLWWIHALMLFIGTVLLMKSRKLGGEIRAKVKGVQSS